MRKLMAVALAAASAFGVGASVADPGPNGHNNYGLCKAYFAGSANGRAHKRNAPPFQALEKAAGVEEGDTPEEIDEKVAAFCSSATPGGKGAPGGDAGGDAGTTGARGKASKGGKG